MVGQPHNVLRSHSRRGATCVAWHQILETMRSISRFTYRNLLLPEFLHSDGEEKIIETSRETAYKKSLEVSNSPPVKELSGKSQRRDEQQVMKVLGPTQLKREHMVHMDCVDNGKGPPESSKHKWHKSHVSDTRSHLQWQRKNATTQSQRVALQRYLRCAKATYLDALPNTVGSL